MNTIAKRYAKAFYKVAEEKNVAESEFKALELLAEAFINEKSKALLESPVTSKIVKKEFLNDVLEKIGASPLFRNFINVVLEANRIPMFIDIKNAYKSFIDAKSNMVDVDLVTATEFSSEELKAIENKLNTIIGKNLKINKTVDKSLLGGFKAEFGNNVIDASLRTKLASLTQAAKI